MIQRLAIAVAALSAMPAFAGIFRPAVPTQVPALDEFGLAGLTLVVAVAGGLAARRRKNRK